MSRRRVATTLDAKESAALRRVQRYVKAMSGIGTKAEALRFLVRNWEPR